MPKLSDNALFALALPLAIADRLGMVDAYAGEGPNAAEAQEQVNTLRALKGKKLGRLTDAENETAFLCFLYAELWEEGLADSNRHSDPELSAASLASAKLFRELRHRRWGKTKWETFAETAVAVPIRDVVDRMPGDKEK